jgi:hypothetical protein
MIWVSFILLTTLPSHIRNICVRYGTVLFMTDNSKLKGSTGKPFWVVRAIPKCLARPLLAYLAYIRPFADSLHRILAPHEAERNACLYMSYHSSRKHFSTTDGSSALYNATSALSMPLKIGIYRQAAVAMAKKHVENPVKIASPWEPSTMAEQISAWQCTHSVQHPQEQLCPILRNAHGAHGRFGSAVRAQLNLVAHIRRSGEDG